MAETLKNAILDRNAKARAEFIGRSVDGLNLSDRVWNNIKPFEKTVEQTLGFAIKNGQSAQETARELKQYLNDPEALFRRVRSEEGELTLSQAARDYNPGQGVYRSSYKNALRLARSETNMAYRLADQLRWRAMPFVIGVEISLSNAHPKYDICDPLEGFYPKDFNWPGWHPQCLCVIKPVLIDRKEYNEIEKARLSGKPAKPIDQIRRPHKGFFQWIEKNKERIKGWKSKPYWIRDNSKFIKL